MTTRFPGPVGAMRTRPRVLFLRLGHPRHQRRREGVRQVGAQLGLDRVADRARHDAGLAGHEGVVSLAGHLGRVVLAVGLPDLGVTHVRPGEELRVHGPGISEVTVTPVSFSSTRMPSAKECTNAFDAAYVEWYGPGVTAAMEEVTRMPPSPAATIARQASLARCTVERTLRSTNVRSSAKDVWSNR